MASVGGGIGKDSVFFLINFSQPYHSFPSFPPPLVLFLPQTPFFPKSLYSLPSPIFSEKLQASSVYQLTTTYQVAVRLDAPLRLFSYEG